MRSVRNAEFIQTKALTQLFMLLWVKCSTLCNRNGVRVAYMHLNTSKVTQVLQTHLLKIYAVIFWVTWLAVLLAFTFI